MPIFAMVAGVLGYFLRLSEKENVFNHITGLPERGSVTTTVLIALSVIFVLIVLIFTICATVRNKSPDRFDLAFGTNSILYPVTFVIIGLLWAVGTFFYFTQIRDLGVISGVDIAFTVLSLLTAVSIVLLSTEVFTVTYRKTPYLLSIVPIIFVCFWLILLYRQNASNPVLLAYAYQIIALVFTALSFYFTAGYVFGRPAPGRAIVSYYCAIYFSAVSLADGNLLGINLLLIAIIAYCMIYSSMMIFHLESRR